MDSANFLAQASAGLNTAAIILLTYIILTLRDIEGRLKHHEALVSKLMMRVQRVSVQQGLPEIEIG